MGSDSLSVLSSLPWFPMELVENIEPAAKPIQITVFVLRCVSPAIVALTAISLAFSKPASYEPVPSSSPITPVVVGRRVPRTASILSLLSLAALTYLLDGIAFVVETVVGKFWQQFEGIEINAVLGLAAFAGLAAYGAIKQVQGVEVWLMKRLKLGVLFSLALDIALVVLLGLSVHKDDQSMPNEPPPTIFRITVFLHLAFPAFRVLMLVPLVGALSLPRFVYSPVAEQTPEEAPNDSSLLVAPSSSYPGSSYPTESTKYGTFNQRSMLQNSTPGTRAPSPVPSSVNAESKPLLKREISLEPSWAEMGRRLRHIAPYLWPSKSPKLQTVATFCILLLLLGRVVNVLLPLALSQTVRVLEGGSKQSPWLFLFGYVALRFLQGSGGLSALRDGMWTSVMQYSDREMSQLAFDHILNLSFAWHTRRKTGEVLRILDRGAAINRTFELLIFNVVPIFVDIIVALVIFGSFFEWTVTLVIFLVTAAYIAASIILTGWRSRIRRQMNEKDIVTRGIHTDCLLNYETVKYFGGEEHEGERYRRAIQDYQALEYRVIVSLNVLNLVQNFITTLGLLIVSLIVAFRVTQGKSDAADFVFLISYLTQLYVPLNQLGSTYRSINQSLVDTERLLELLDEPSEVKDKPDAKPLNVTGGEIEFDNVSFSYDGRTTALNGISFKVPKGSSVALVGDSGAGKSTILRLLYRFYDLAEGHGRILIDGQNIKDVTQKSLRQSIGVVPQDSILFNTSVRYNIAYGKFDASDEEIETAARSAQMHDRILSFPDGYDTKVGERGVRLSGGEKQRVSIARTLLKNPPVLLLDEATSALDTSTEKDIQKALQNLMTGRSSLSIAHRLSTIASADVILVLKDGQIVEQGSHRELLALDGIFASMWADQVTGSEDGLLGQDDKSKHEAPSTHHNEDEPLVEQTASISGGAGGVTFPLTDEPETIIPVTATAPTPAGPAAEPSPADVPDAPPVTFPSSEEPEKPLPSPPPPGVATPARASGETSTPHGVTFDDNAVAPSTAGGTPDPNAEPKRQRTASQNLKRLGRRLSISRRDSSTSSSIFPNVLGRKDKDKGKDSPRVSIDDGSVRGTGSPASSILGDTVKGKKDKKDKKKKRGSQSASTGGQQQPSEST